MNDSVVGSFVVVGIGLLIAIGVTSLTTEFHDPTYDLTCDELSFKIADNPDSYFHSRQVYHEKCIPDEVKKASLLEIAEYFSNMKCNDLANHIVKRHFESEQAQLVFKFKCGDPANVNLDEIKISFDKSEKIEIEKNPKGRR